MNRSLAMSFRRTQQWNNQHRETFRHPEAPEHVRGYAEDHGGETMLRKLVMLVLLGYVVSKVMNPGERRVGMTGARAANRQAELRRRRQRAGDWDMVDERSDESFPASDPPGTY